MLHLVIIAIGLFFTGFIDAIAGGGGIISVPLLIWSGLPIKTAIATNKVGGFIGNGTTSYNYYKKGKVNLKIVFMCAPAALIGAALGAQLLNFIPSENLEKGIPYVLIALVLYTLFSKNLGIKSNVKEHTLKTNILLILSVFLVGIYNGFFGPASGSFLTISLVSIFGFSFLEGTANSKPINWFMTCASIITFLIMGNVDIRVGIVCAVFRSIGAKLGSNYAVKVEPKKIKYIFITVTTLVIVKMLVF